MIDFRRYSGKMSYIDNLWSRSVHKEPEYFGGFAELAKKGIKIKDYKENIPKSRKK